jgi:hypothetical protein
MDKNCATPSSFMLEIMIIAKKVDDWNDADWVP